MAKHGKVRGELNGLLSGFLASRRKAKVIPYLCGRKRILDVGCGIFDWQEKVLPDDAEFVGIDCEEEVIRFNQDNFPHKFLHGDVEKSNLEFAENEFDLIILLAVLEHLEDPVGSLRKLTGKLSSGGLIVLTTPHPLGKTVLHAGAAIHLLSRDKHQHKNLFDYAQIEKLARSVCCHIIKYRRFLLGFNQFVVLEKD